MGARKSLVDKLYDLADDMEEQADADLILEAAREINRLGYQADQSYVLYKLGYADGLHDAVKETPIKDWVTNVEESTVDVRLQ